MKCPRCLQDNLATPKFCEHCGFPLDRACAVCGGQLSALAKFCPHCGCALEGFPRSADDRFASPGSYTPRHLAEKIFTSRAALEAAIVANYAAGVEVGKLGAATVSAAEVLEAYDHHLAEG